MISKYGRTIIETLFKRWTKRTPIRAEFESKREADCDRSDIRMFEIGLSAEQHGDYQQSTRPDTQKICSLLIELAKAHNLYIPQLNGISLGNANENHPEKVSFILTAQRIVSSKYGIP